MGQDEANDNIKKLLDGLPEKTFDKVHQYIHDKLSIERVVAPDPERRRLLKENKNLKSELDALWKDASNQTRHAVEKIHLMCHTIVDRRHNIEPTITKEELLEYVEKCRDYFYEMHKLVHKILKIPKEIPKP